MIMSLHTHTVEFYSAVKKSYKMCKKIIYLARNSESPERHIHTPHVFFHIYIVASDFRFVSLIRSVCRGQGARKGLLKGWRCVEEHRKHMQYENRGRIFQGCECLGGIGSRRMVAESEKY